MYRSLPDELEAAIRSIERAMKALDITGTPCECCTHIHYNQWSHFQCYQQMSSVLKKLEKWASHPDTKDLEVPA